MRSHLFGVADVHLGEVVPLAVEGLEVAGRFERVPEPLGIDPRGLHLLLREARLHLRSRGISRIFVISFTYDSNSWCCYLWTDQTPPSVEFE